MRLPEPISAMIFDCDGTLVDSEPIHAAAIAQILVECGVEISAELILQRYTGCDNGTLLRRVGKQHGISWPADIEVRIEEASHTLLSDAKIPLPEDPLKGSPFAMPGALALLDELRTRGIGLAVASNSRHRLVEVMLLRAHLTEYFGKRLATRDLVEHPKPAPDLYRLAAELCMAVPESCVAVEDSPAGVRAAAATGMTVIGYRSTRSIISAHELASAGALTVIEHFNQLEVTLCNQLHRPNTPPPLDQPMTRRP